VTIVFVLAVLGSVFVMLTGRRKLERQRAFHFLLALAVTGVCGYLWLW
jgi:hypothetical protein